MIVATAEHLIISEVSVKNVINLKWVLYSEYNGTRRKTGFMSEMSIV